MQLVPPSYAAALSDLKLISSYQAAAETAASRQRTCASASRAALSPPGRDYPPAILNHRRHAVLSSLCTASRNAHKHKLLALGS